MSRCPSKILMVGWRSVLFPIPKVFWKHRCLSNFLWFWEWGLKILFPFYKSSYYLLMLNTFQGGYCRFQNMVYVFTISWDSAQQSIHFCTYLDNPPPPQQRELKAYNFFTCEYLSHFVLKFGDSYCKVD